MVGEMQCSDDAGEIVLGLLDVLQCLVPVGDVLGAVGKGVEALVAQVAFDVFKGIGEVEPSAEGPAQLVEPSGCQWRLG